MAFGLILTFGRVLSVLSVMHWLALLFLLFAAGCVIVTATEKHTEKTLRPKSPPLFPPATFIPEVRQRGRTTIWIGLVLVMVAGLAGTAGYGIRDHQLTINSHTYWDVAVLDKYSDISFRIQPARMQDGQWDFCAPVPFQKHDELRYITFEQQNGCKRLEYFQKLDSRLGEKLDAAIPMR